MFYIINSDWDTPNLVCDDDFDTIDAQSACYTLGYSNGGSFRGVSWYHSVDWSEAQIPFLKDNVECHRHKNVALTCNASGETIFQGALVDSNEMS